jgi:hypothetical protein
VAGARQGRRAAESALRQRLEPPPGPDAPVTTLRAKNKGSTRTTAAPTATATSTATTKAPAASSPSSATVDAVAAQERARHPRGSSAVKSLDRMTAAPGFGALKEDEQVRMLRVMGGTNTVLSKGARASLDQLTGSSAFRKADAAGQAAQFRQLMTDQSWTPYVVSSAVGDTPSRKPWSVSGTSEKPGFGFEGGKFDAVQHDVKVGNHVVPVMVPKSKVAGAPTVEEVAKGLAALPESSLRAIKRVDVEPTTNPQDAYWAKTYGQPDFRSYMTAGSAGIVNIFPAKNQQPQSILDASLVHETGHVISQQKWGGSYDGGKWKGWNTAAAKDGIATSKYGRNSPGEDFSESLVLYQRVVGTPLEQEWRGIMPEKFKILDAMTK